MFSNLTEIARVEARLGREEFEPVDAGALAGELADFYGPVGQERAIVVADHPDRVSFLVSDSGPGIPDDFIEQATRPFATQDPSRQGKHSGLGLAMAAAVARLHDGQLRIANRHPGLSVMLELSRNGGGLAP